MSSITDRPSEKVSDRPFAAAFAKEAAKFSDKIIKLAESKRGESKKLDSKALSLVEYLNFVYFWQRFRLFTRQFATRDFFKDYCSVDETCRLDVVIACSYDFEVAFATMEEHDDGWRFPGWLKDNGVLKSLFEHLCRDWHKARDELCDVLGVVLDKTWKLDMSLIIQDNKIDRLPIWMSICNTGTGESCTISMTGDGYAEETSINDVTMMSTVERIKRSLASLSGTERSDRVWLS